MKNGQEATNPIVGEPTIFDARTAPIEEIARVFGISLSSAYTLKLQELGLSDGDVMEVDFDGKPLSPSTSTDALALSKK